jgi:hypothetical protein
VTCVAICATSAPRSFARARSSLVPMPGRSNTASLPRSTTPAAASSSSNSDCLEKP